MQQVVEFFSQKGFDLYKFIDVSNAPFLSFRSRLRCISVSAVLLQVVLTFPQVLGYSVPERLEPFFLYLEQELELSNDEIVSMIDRRPVLLGLQRDNVERLIGYLKANGSSKEEQIRLLETSL